MDCSTPGSSVLHHLPELAQLMSIESVMSSIHLIVCCLPSIFPSIKGFSNETALHIRWPKYWRREVEARKSSFRLKQTDPSRRRSPLGLSEWMFGGVSPLSQLLHGYARATLKRGRACPLDFLKGGPGCSDGKTRVTRSGW